MNAENRKAVARRLVREVIVGGRLEVMDELYEPELAARARVDRAVSDLVQ